MPAVLHLDPVLRPASLIRAIPPLRHQTFKTRVAGRSKQVWPDLARLERRNEDAIRVGALRGFPGSFESPRGFFPASRSLLRDGSIFRPWFRTRLSLDVYEGRHQRVRFG